MPAAALHDDLVATLDSHPQPSDGIEAWREAARHPHNLTRRGFPDHFTASALPLTVDGSSVCLVLHKRMGVWVQPGGHLERDDRTLTEAAGREVHEETGLVTTVLPPPLLLSRHPAPCRPGAWHLDFQYLAIVADPAIRVSDESDDVAWFPVDDLPRSLAPGVDDLVTAARQRLNRNASGGSTPLPE